MCATITIADRLQSHPLFQANERASEGDSSSHLKRRPTRGEQLQVRPTEKFPVVPCSFIGLSAALDFPCRHFRGCITRGLFFMQESREFPLVSSLPLSLPESDSIRRWRILVLSDFLPLCMDLVFWPQQDCRSNPLSYFFANFRILAENV